MLKFAANVNMMFNELPSIAQRIFAAKKAGFEAVEITMPYIEKKEPIAEALRNTGIQCVLINASSGDLFCIYNAHLSLHIFKYHQNNYIHNQWTTCLFDQGGCLKY